MVYLVLWLPTFILMIGRTYQKKANVLKTEAYDLLLKARLKELS